MSIIVIHADRSAVLLLLSLLQLYGEPHDVFPCQLFSEDVTCLDDEDFDEEEEQ